LSRDPARVGDIASWAAESYALATSLAYRAELSETSGQAKALDHSYVEKTSAAAERRLTLSGYRLADLLRHIFPSRPTQP
jgi:S1/P1 Nuclease